MLALVVLAALSGPAAAISGMATTTHYNDGQKGACGCGTSSGNFPWQLGIGNNVYTAAGSQALFDAGGSSWCGSGCGTCFELSSTGKAPAGQGQGGTPGQNITVMLTNLCPNNGNEQWCPQPNQKNTYGYEYHFDLNAAQPLIGDNPIVNFRSVPCPGQAASDYQQCQCSKGGNGGSSATPAAGSSPTPEANAGQDPFTGMSRAARRFRRSGHRAQ